eukprot:11188229-Lingulodinium_polyedra.AAC.1
MCHRFRGTDVVLREGQWGVIVVCVLTFRARACERSRAVIARLRLHVVVGTRRRSKRDELPD